jgi:peroxiredoxin
MPDEPNPMPYGWLNVFLANAAVGWLILAVGLLVASFLSRRFPPARLRRLALGAFGAMLLTGAANYAVIFGLMLPAMADAQEQQADEMLQRMEQDEEGETSSTTPTPSAEASAPMSVARVGRPAPRFSVRMADGTERSSDELRGKVVVVNFFATWCGPCLRELPHLQEIYDRHRGDDRFALLTIGREETPETLREFAREHRWTFPMAADEERKAYDQFARETIPRVYVIAPDGTIAFQSVGYSKRGITRLNAAIDKLLR